jgi:carbamoyl-phosphate synthase large subunit
MNILLTCAGRRNYMVDYFRKALAGSGKVYVTNSDPDATAMLVADQAFVSPPLYSPEYPSFLLGLCREYRIGMLVSLFDLELPVLADHREEFEKAGVIMAVSSKQVVEICNDKLAANQFLEALGLSALFTTTELSEAKEALQSQRVSFPLYIKPRWGMGSIAMQQAENMSELEVLYDKVKRDEERSYLRHHQGVDQQRSVMIQEKANGKEYGLDVVNDLNGNHVTVFVKRKLAMRAGETDMAITEDNPRLCEIGKKIGTALRHRGNLDVDVFWDGKQATVLEMNVRFGGGYPFSHIAGANLPLAYLYWARNEQAPDACFALRTGVRAMKGIELIVSR